MIKPIDTFTAIDLEMNQPSGKIIQIGACVFNLSSGILHKFSIFVNPHEDLNPFITNLTGISQEQVDEGVPFVDAYSALYTLHTSYRSFVNPVTWGQGDVEAIRRHMMGPDPSTPIGWPFGRRIIDVKTLFVAWRLSQGLPIQGGLAKSMLKVGLKFEGRKHDALDDAVNTARMYIEMLKKFRV